jgi:hypothetical protein
MRKVTGRPVPRLDAAKFQHHSGAIDWLGKRPERSWRVRNISKKAPVWVGIRTLSRGEISQSINARRRKAPNACI